MIFNSPILPKRLCFVSGGLEGALSLWLEDTKIPLLRGSCAGGDSADHSSGKMHTCSKSCCSLLQRVRDTPRDLSCMHKQVKHSVEVLGLWQDLSPGVKANHTRQLALHHQHTHPLAELSVALEDLASRLQVELCLHRLL